MGTEESVVDRQQRGIVMYFFFVTSQYDSSVIVRSKHGQRNDFLHDCVDE